METTFAYRMAYQKYILRKELLRVLQKLRHHLAVDRIRLYSLSQDGLSLNGQVELGGVQENFARLQIPLETDILSQTVFQILFSQGPPVAVLFQRRKNSGFVSYSTPGNGVTQLKAIPHDLAALDRQSLTQWLDIPLVYTGKDNEFHLIMGKVTADNRWSPKKRIQFDTVMKEPNQWRELVDHAVNALYQYSEVLRQNFKEQQTSLAPTMYKQAYGRLLLDDHLRTILVNFKANTGLDRLRAYLTLEKHEQLFGELSPNDAGSSSSQGIRGVTELGGVLADFADLQILCSEDDCTRNLWERGDDCDPVVYYHERTCENLGYLSRIKKFARQFPHRYCGVQGFHRPNLLDRGWIGEHVDVPLVCERQLIGKVTIDRRWSEQGTPLPVMEDRFCETLKCHAEEIVNAIKSVENAVRKDDESRLQLVGSIVEDLRSWRERPVIDRMAGPGLPARDLNIRFLDDLGELKFRKIRQLVVLYADLRNSTRFTKYALGPTAPCCHPSVLESFRDFLVAYHDKMTDIIGECGGRLDKYVGDGLIAEFGLSAREAFDDPCTVDLRIVENAVVCALRMRAEFREMFENWLRSTNGVEIAKYVIPIDLGIGIHVGEAEIGNLGSRHRPDVTALGDCVNHAAKLEKAARRQAIGQETEVGVILISSRMWSFLSRVNQSQTQKPFLARPFPLADFQDDIPFEIIEVPG